MSAVLAYQHREPGNERSELWTPCCARLSWTHWGATGPGPLTAQTGFQEELLSVIEAVHRFAIHLARDAVQAEDLVQETYLRALAHRDQYQPGTNCRAWLFQICRNAFLKERAHVSREEPADDADLEALAATGLYAGVLGTDPVGGVFERPELADAVARALSRLPEEYRTAVTLVDLEDQSYADAGK